jgi:protein-disulfide isomerase
MSQLTVPVSDRDHVRGSLDAPAILVEYGDYECPYCGQAFPIVHKVIEALGDRVAFVFRNFPLTQIHPHAEHAAEAAEAAEVLGGADAFWAMHDTLFENQRALEDEDLLSYASELGLEAKTFAEALATGQFAPRVKEDFMSGVRSGVNGTPTFFVNGARYEGDWTNASEFAAALAAPATQPSGR